MFVGSHSDRTSPGALVARPLQDQLWNCSGYKAIALPRKRCDCYQSSRLPVGRLGPIPYDDTAIQGNRALGLAGGSTEAARTQALEVVGRLDWKRYV